MKKFLGIFVAVMLCLCMVVPCFAATSTVDTDTLLSKLDGVDLKNLNSGEIAKILGVDVSDLGNVVEALKNSDSSASDAVDYVIKSLTATGSTATTAASGAATTAAASGSDSALSGISDLLGGIDLSSIASSDMLSSLTGLFDGVDLSSFDVSSLMDTISGAFSGSGIDLSSIDIGSLLSGIGGGSDNSGTAGSGSGSGDAASGIMDKMASIMDSLKSGLGSLGLDTSALDGLKDNEVVSFFASLYQGLGKVDETTTAKPEVATTKTPKTGDTSAVVTAVVTLSVASAAAFVCLKTKKKDEA